jgi:hypothetical protein
MFSLQAVSMGGVLHMAVSENGDRIQFIQPKIMFMGKIFSSTMKCAVFLPAYLFQAKQNLVGGLEHVLFLHSVGNVIIPIDFKSMIFQRGWWLNHQPEIVH